MAICTVFAKGDSVNKKYFDDILTCSEVEELLPKVRVVIEQPALELVFSSEERIGGVLQFLDLRLSTLDRLCWEYRKLAAKPLLLIQSYH